MVLENIKILFEIPKDDTTRDDILTVLYNYAKSAITLYVGAERIPQSLIWIAEQLTIRKYNKLGEEGIQSSNYEGIQLQYEESDLGAFQDYLDRYVDLHPLDTKKKGRLRML